MRSQSVKIADGGKLVIPAQFRRELGISVGDTVVVEMSDGMLHVRSLSAAIRCAQDVVREFVPEGESLAERLIDDRRSEAADEGRVRP